MIKVMLVDDQNLVRKGVRSLLELSEEIEVIAEAPDGIEAIRTIPGDWSGRGSAGYAYAG